MIIYKIQTGIPITIEIDQISNLISNPENVILKIYIL